MNKNRSLLKGWKWTELGEVSRVFAGGTAPQNKIYFASTGIPFFRVSDLSVKGRTLSLQKSRDYLSVKKIAELRLVAAKKGTVIFPKSGAAIATNNRGILGVDGYIVSHFMALEANSKTTPEWLYYTLCQINMMEYIENPGYPSLKKTVVEKIKIPIPPLAEQKRIMQMLERQLATAEKARIAAEKRLSDMNALSAAILHAVFSSAESQKWQRKKIGEVCEATRGTSITKQDTIAGKYPVIAGGQTPAYFHNQFNREGKTITISGSGAYAGFTAYHTTPIFASDCTTLQIPQEDNLLVKFLFLSLKSRQADIYKAQTGGSQPHVYCRDIIKMEIAFPPLAEQKRIVQMLERQLAPAKKLQVAIAVELDEINILPAAFLRQALAIRL